MADSDKIITVTPNTSVATTHPEIKLVGKDDSPMYLKVLDDNTLSFEGTEGQVFSIGPTMSSGDIFSVNDISGIQNMSVNADGTIKIIPTGTNPSSNLYLGDLRHCFVYARGTGNNNAANSLIYLNGKKIIDNNVRGMYLTILNQIDLSVVSSTRYDTYSGGTTNVNNLATAIGNMTDQQIGILVSEDAWEPNSSNGTNLWAAAKLVGLTKLGHYDGGDGSVRRPYAAIFMGSGDDANAANKFVIERMSDADADAPMASVSAILVSDGVHASISGAQYQNALWSSDSNHEEPALIVDEDKQVGIGTATPDSTLHLKGVTSGYGYLKFETDGSVGSIKSDYNLDLYADDTAGNSSGYQNIRFFTAGANERMRVAHDGKVGIGTTSPEQKLHVIGDIVSASGEGNNAAKDGRYLFSTYSHEGDGSKHEWTGMYGYSGNGYNSLYLGGGTGSHEPASTIRFHTGADGSNAAGTERMRILEDGKVGIGEDDPGSLLEIRGATTIGTTTGHIMLTGDSATNGQGPQIVFSESGSGSSYAGAYIGHARTGSNSMGDLIFGTRATGGDANTVPTEKMRILANGRVGIGDSTPSYALDVVGDIHATGQLLSNGNIRSGSRLSLNTMTYYHFDRQSVGTNGTYFLRVPVGGSSNANRASYFMPLAGNVMVILLEFYGQTLATSGTDTWRVNARDPDDTLHTCDFNVNFANLVRVGTQNNYSILCDVSALDDAIDFAAGAALSIQRDDLSPIDVEHVAAQIWVTFDA
jgi:hypothetical protein